MNDAVLAAAQRLAAAGIDNPSLEARLLVAAALGISRDRHPDVARRFRRKRKSGFAKPSCERRERREPIAYLTGYKEFWSLDFQVGPGVLVPRPDTETLIEEALRLVPDRNAPLRIADLGTGSGAILVAALTEFPNATGIGLESSPDAFEWAARQCRPADAGSRTDQAGGLEHGPRAFRSRLLQPALHPFHADIESLAPDVSQFRATPGPGRGPRRLVGLPVIGGTSAPAF